VEQAPVVNRLYDLVAKSDLKDKVKFLAVGESDNRSSLQRFKAAHKVPFPLVPDPDWAFCSVCTVSGTPTTILVDQSGKVLLKEDGAFDNASQMFKKIKAKLK
jgi:hypothetical protein